MATFTATSESGTWANATTSYDSPRIGGGRLTSTVTVGGLIAASAGIADDRVPRTWSGSYEQDGQGTEEYDTARLGSDLSITPAAIIELDPVGHTRTGAWDGPTIGRPGHYQPDGQYSAQTSTDWRLGQHNDPVPAEVVEVEPSEDAVDGTLIPTAYFRAVTGLCVDEDGEPIRNGKWIVATEGLPTAGKVNDQGRFLLRLLRTDYAGFMLLVESADPNVDLVWYEHVETVIETGSEHDVTLTFKEAHAGGGLMAGAGVSMGL